MTDQPTRPRRLPILGFFQTREDLPTIDDAGTIARRYRAGRWTTFTAVTLGYSFFYFTRLTLSVAKKPLVDAGLVNAEQLGTIGSVFFFAYAFGRLTNGFLCDRAHIGRFMGFGLLVSAIINILFGSSKLVVVFIVLWCLNGWFQSMGSAPSVANIAAWFTRKERGVRYSIWSMAHNLGEGMTFVITASIIGALGWQWGFWGPGAICIVVALILFKTILDRPETYGLPPIAEYRGEPSHVSDADDQTVGQSQLQVLRNPAIWIVGLASACLYIARYGINNWFVFYLQAAKSYGIEAAGATTALSPIIGAAGTLSAGPISDYLFGGRRIPVSLMFGVVLIIGLVAIPLVPPGYVWADSIAVSVCGFAIGGLLVFLGGLIAVDISSKRAAGAAMGVIGVFSYLGAAAGDYIGGWLLESNSRLVDGVKVYDFDPLLFFWIGAGIVSFVLTATLWRPGRSRTA
jgi:MFS transporter, OPA family, sugar phosphate sensor protein UhpC